MRCWSAMPTSLPVRYMVLDRVTPAAYDYAFYPSDLYYADVARRDGSFDDWNARKDGFHGSYFGEVRGEKNKKDPINFDQIDYRPELAVGRWPVDSVAEVKLVAEKTDGTGSSECGGQRARLHGARHSSMFRAGSMPADRWTDGLHELPKGWKMLEALWRRPEAQAAERTPSHQPSERGSVAGLPRGPRGRQRLGSAA